MTDDRMFYLMCRLVESGISLTGDVLRVVTKFLKSFLSGRPGSALGFGVSPAADDACILETKDDFQGWADAVLCRPKTTAVLAMVASAVHAALAAEGYPAGEWGGVRSKDEDRNLRVAQWVAAFQDPLSGCDFQATIRVHIGNFGALHTTRIWMDLCRSGEQRNAPDSVSQALAERNWHRLPLVEARASILQELTEWVRPDSAQRIGRRTHELVADLTTILAP